MSSQVAELVKTKPAIFSSLNDLYNLREAVLGRKPVLRKVLDKFGSQKLSDYIKGYSTSPVINAERQQEFFVSLRKEISQRLGVDVAARTTAQLGKRYLVTTADHLGPLSPPDFINAHLANAANTVADTAESPSIVVLACSNISLHNPTFPRGFTFRNSGDGLGAIIRQSLLPKKVVGHMAYGFPAYKQDAVNRIRKSVMDLKNGGSINATAANKLDSILDDVYLREDVLDCNTYSEQVSKTNHSLWKNFFDQSKNYPELIYLDQESLVVRLLLENHLTRSTIVNSLIFDEAWSKVLVNFFDGIEGAFSTRTDAGTYIFWGISPQTGYRVRLVKKDKKLISTDNSFCLDLTPECVAEALQKKQLVPSSLLDFIVLSFYYGVTCLGGTSQINYLTQMKIAYGALMNEFGRKEDYEISQAVPTDQLCCDFYLLFLSIRGSFFPASAFDLLMYGNSEIMVHTKKVIEATTLEEAITPALPEYYAAMYGKNERLKDLEEITLENIVNVSNLKQKILPYITI